ncbi:MAG: hypothetical protein OXG38_02795 [Chloroflexi bacterium]|nr:hypothetical protein [Chloroflexota bacterium]
MRGPIWPRRRASGAGTKDPEKECLVFIDECGSHTVNVRRGEFGAFCLAAVLVAAEAYGAFCDRWNRWKEATWGSSRVETHEPDVRRRNGRFWCGGDRTEQAQLVESLGRELAALEFTGIVVVVRRDAYASEFGQDSMDTSLPSHVYLVALDFLCERIALALQTEFAGARGRLIAESRGPKEDAQLQQEFVRLHIDGTSYIHPSWIRRQMFPGILFHRKQDYIPGLEVADLLARPCGEKVLDPKSDPERWAELSPKLCSRRETAHSPLGLKIVPWDDDFEGLIKS